MKYIVGAALVAVAVLAVGFIVGLAAMMLSSSGHANGGAGDRHIPSRGAGPETRSFVTNEPGDQKANMGMYDDANGPPWGGIPHVAVAHMPFGSCAKPGVVIDADEHGNDIYAADDEVIWRCIQTNRITGEWYDRNTHPMVYCHVQREQPAGRAKAWRCYHDYSVVFNFYEHEYGRAPLVLPDEVEFIDTTEYR